MNKERQFKPLTITLQELDLPSDLKNLTVPQCTALCDEIRGMLIRTVLKTGGHLASIVANIAERNAKPNFQILFYPVITMMQGYCHQGSHDNFLGKGNQKRKEKNYSSDMLVTRTTPKAWIALSDDDNVVEPSNGANYYMELYRHDVPASLHIYPGGGHGWGSRLSFKYHIEMIMELKAWLDSF